MDHIIMDTVTESHASRIERLFSAFLAKLEPLDLPKKDAFRIIETFLSVIVSDAFGAPVAASVMEKAEDWNLNFCRCKNPNCAFAHAPNTPAHPDTCRCFGDNVGHVDKHLCAVHR